MNHLAFTCVSLLATSSPALAADAQVSTPPAGAVETFGAPLGADKAVALSEVLKNPDAFANKTVLVSGQVRKSCSQKGCWMELAESADKANQGCRVTFKDYGFFVPLNSKGSSARVAGVLSVKTVSKGEVQHLEGEGATFAKKFPDGTAREVRIVATGVELTGRQR